MTAFRGMESLQPAPLLNLVVRRGSPEPTEVWSVLRERYPDMPALLAAVRERPGMFLGHQTVRGLHLLLCGIDFAEDFHGVPEADRIGGFDQAAFERWVESRHNPGRLSLNSFGLAAHLAGSEAAGFDLWFGWYDAFVGGGSA